VSEAKNQTREKRGGWGKGKERRGKKIRWMRNRREEGEE
jgi:hypothetical protein